MNRVIGTFEGRHGPLIFALGGVHGNEQAGVHALEEVLKMLQEVYEPQPDLEFAGKFLAVTGNTSASKLGKRFIDCDLNRLWTATRVSQILRSTPESRNTEEQELSEILTLLKTSIEEYKPTALVILDLHTTSAEGGIFCIPSGNPRSIRLARELHAPVILGLLDGIDGTMLHFIDHSFNQFIDAEIPVLGAAFEGGQHDHPHAVSACIAGVLNCLRASGCIAPEALYSAHDQFLEDYSSSLPKVTQLEYVHQLSPGDHFRMKPGYFNFKSIHAGEHLADDVHGPIHSKCNGRILMPLYQDQGTDGFFMVNEI